MIVFSLDTVMDHGFGHSSPSKEHFYPKGYVVIKGTFLELDRRGFSS